ncbi:MAG: DUF308 domain-containing protein [Acholeplasmatales bacterium]|nr:DUF308 domain-containing protein [Acholeplasmatales bacterium]
MKIKKSKTELYLAPLLDIIMGVLIMIFKGEVIRWAALALGIIVVVMAAINIIGDMKSNNNQATVFDVALILIGALIIVFAGAFAAAIRIIVGVLLMCYGVLKLLSIMDALPKQIKIILIVEAVLYFTAGILLFLDKSVLYYILGAILVFNGVVDILYSMAEAKLINEEEKKNNPHSDAIDAEIKEK